MNRPPSHTEDIHLSETTVEEMLQTKLNLSSIKIQGTKLTNPRVIEYVIQPCQSTGGTFEGVVGDVSAAIERLRQTGCYKGVDALLDRGATQHDAAAIFTLTEKSQFQLHTGTSVQTGGDREASADFSVMWRNITGRADSIKGSLSWMGRSFATAPSSSWDAEYINPFGVSRDANLFIRGRRATFNHEQQSSYVQHVRSGSIGTESSIGVFAINTAWRELAHVDSAASPLVRAEAGHSWKTSLSHHLVMDERDHPPMPTAGSMLSVFNEVALPVLGNVAHLKSEATWQAHAPIGASGISFAVSARGGAVLAREGRVRIIDRHFLGGPNSFRGFQTRGIGTRDGKDAVGGDLFYTLMGCLSLPMPESSLLSQLFHARMNFFGTVGDLTEIERVKNGFGKVFKTESLNNVSKTAKDTWNDLYQSMRVAVGLGLALETSVGRVELNFCKPLRTGKTDESVTGFQFSFSKDFL